MVKQLRDLLQSAADEHVKIPDQIKEEAEAMIQTQPEINGRNNKKKAEGKDDTESVPEAQAESSPSSSRRKRTKTAGGAS